jgi:hypothetical protein
MQFVLEIAVFECFFNNIVKEFWGLSNKRNSKNHHISNPSQQTSLKSY